MMVVCKFDIKEDNKSVGIPSGTSRTSGDPEQGYMFLNIKRNIL